MGLQRKSLLGLKDMEKSEIESILDSTESMKEIVQRKNKKLPTLKGFSMVNLFYEPSTRTRSSFEMAGKYLGADTTNMSASASSVAKGENLIDTGKTLEAMGINLIVMRHPLAGAPRLLANNLSCSIINAGDGYHEHPTQALLDMFTIKEYKGSLKGLKVTIIGDIYHSRVARSNIWGLTKMGADVRLAGPPTLLDQRVFTEMGASCYYRVEDALADADVVMALRIQRERQGKTLLPSLREYARLYGINQERFKLAKKDALLLHPGPVNRGIELTSELMNSEKSVIEEQVTNGVAIRMALLYHLSGGEDNGDIA
ncbi:aspartate carbamoyltransferase catalytic subunit [Natranaerobius thermophilus]|uniref:Aspartate carbamoyltransferase catalytic subunit n=1 Tax=Natranaerobius thermophilus (strain ATCC BAA-1301 / DSM 18059 / JW/NM-WN-LF) TaxID=457570 RepID=PYRB_NATTJ|nr:aspartate carbamoyltransferase catalytic subunit [Natranaerobius thermophilus]B2A2U7.1 RecName: Full=Aspartate carbamoyltransferase catalytic subunit; AltName: Full=Aspartate transcarbamylase; Short=ATCase [Natranaerobius thermophilus JW/NM-WN-LF]ACB86315.1 aspartate carbamoyltransferase [Natranaerobius thermophilus JW/NM-WN-LF]